jgi:subtilisin family serine protease
MYLALAEQAGRRYVETFFTTDEATPYLKEMIPTYAELDAVDLVIRSVGYGAKVDVPERQMFANEVSPEFERQGGLDGGRFREAHERTRGEGVRIAILDTGIDESHSIFEHTSWGEHFSLVERTGPPWASAAPVIDWGAHGTLISSVVTVYAPEAQLTMYKFGDGELQNDPPYQLLTHGFVAAAIYRAVRDGNDIISVSAAGSTLDSDDLREAVEYAHAQNRIVVAGTAYSRWTEAGFTRNYPGQYLTVVSVTAAEPRGDGLYGYWPVAGIDSATAVAGPNDVFGAFPTYMEEEDTYIPSISAAIPTVAAAFALAASVYPRLGTEEPGEYADELMRIVIESANPQKVGFEGFSPECGYGLIDAAEAVRRATEMAERRQQ